MSLLKHVIPVTVMIAAAIWGAATPVYGYKVVATYPHSSTSYAEGFFYSNGLFYEGTGLKGHSQFLVYEPKTGTVKQSVDLPPQFFGEGIVDWGFEPLRMDVADERWLRPRPRHAESLAQV
jgi:glutamine cyclotransferase